MLDKEKEYTIKFHEQLINFTKERLPEFKKETFERQKQTDNVVVWIAGLSTGAIALILSVSKDAPIIDMLYLKISAIFFLLTIISAVIFRSFVYNLQQKESDIMFGFEGYLFGVTCGKFGPIKIMEYHTIEDIANSLKNDMNLNYDDWLNYDYLDREFWVEHYERWAKFWNNEEKEGLKNLSMALAPLMGKLPQEVDEKIITEYDNTKQIKILIALRIVCYKAYNFVMLFFILAILTITLGFIVV